MNALPEHRPAPRCVAHGERPALVPTGAWRVDPARSTVGFRVRHLRLATVGGRFREFSCGIDHEPGGNVHARGSVEVGSIDTGDAIRDEHLRARQFLDAQRWPQIRLDSHSIEPANGGFAVSGTLTIKGVERPIELVATAEPLDSAAVRLRAEGTIRRRDFGLDWPGLLDAGRIIVGDRIEVELDIVATRTAAPKAGTAPATRLGSGTGQVRPSAKAPRRAGRADGVRGKAPSSTPPA